LDALAALLATQAETLDALTRDFDEVCADAAWVPPWRLSDPYAEGVSSRDE